MVINDDQGERFEERISGGDTAGAGKGGGKAASRGADKKMCTPVLFIFTLIARLQAEVVQQISSSSLFSPLFILIVFKVDRLRREGEEGRRRSSSQEAHYRTTEQVKFLMAKISTEYVFKLCLDMLSLLRNNVNAVCLRTSSLTEKAVSDTRRHLNNSLAITLTAFVYYV